MCEHNKIILPKVSHPNPASAHWSLNLLHSSSALQCCHLKIKSGIYKNKIDNEFINVNLISILSDEAVVKSACKVKSVS